MEPVGPRLGGAGNPGVDRAKVTEGAGPGSVLLLHDADDYSAPDSWRRTVAALPSVIETMRERSVEPVFP